MGTRFAPSFANLFMGKFEKYLLKIYYLKPKLWLRFIDDIFLVWTHGEHELNKFVEHTNSVHPTIKLTCDYSSQSVNFLDTKVILDPNTKRLHTTLYTKPTDTRDFLHFTSAHPPHSKTGGPYGQFCKTHLYKKCKLHQGKPILISLICEERIPKENPKSTPKKSIST